MVGAVCLSNNLRSAKPARRNQVESQLAMTGLAKDVMNGLGPVDGQTHEKIALLIVLFPEPDPLIVQSDAIGVKIALYALSRLSIPSQAPINAWHQNTSTMTHFYHR